MPARAAGAGATPAAIAPDGIAIHTFDVPAGTLSGVAEGRIPTGTYAIHGHLSLEQYTYVIAGRLAVVTAGAGEPDAARIELGAGDLLLTAPGESLQFINRYPETARVLFICAPPYPAGDADTRLLLGHGPFLRHVAADAIARLESVRAALNAAIDARIEALK
jgi:mannose-6-phosphate isomerase-like protein (cupin superfamily)